MRFDCYLKGVALPDSVKVYCDSIIIAESGKDRILVVKNGQVDYWVEGVECGAKGFSEPVNATLFEGRLYICDWFNHRVVIIENGQFVGQVGVPGLLSGSFLRSCLFFLKSLGMSGTYNDSHFDGKSQNLSQFSLKKGVVMLFFYARRIGLFVRCISNKEFINKPNDCLIRDSTLYITQKDNRCVTIYDLERKKVLRNLVMYPDGLGLGRLGQMCEYGARLYFCDETNSRVGVLERDMVVGYHILALGFKPFSISVSDKLIVIGGESAVAFYTIDWVKLDEIDFEGECHGVTIFGAVVLVADRLNGRVLSVSVEHLL